MKPFREWFEDHYNVPYPGIKDVEQNNDVLHRAMEAVALYMEELAGEYAEVQAAPLTAIESTVIDYWLQHYVDKHCTLCGNSGYIDSLGVRTAAGLVVGRLNWCICPNGQSIRRQSGLKFPPQ